MCIMFEVKTRMREFTKESTAAAKQAAKFMGIKRKHYQAIIIREGERVRARVLVMESYAEAEQACPSLISFAKASITLWL